MKKTAEDAKVDYRALVSAIDTPGDLARDAAIAELFNNTENPVSQATIARVVIQAGEIVGLREYGDSLLQNAPDVVAALKADEERVAETKKTKAKEEHARAGNVALQWLEGEGILSSDKLKEAAKEGVAMDWETMKPVPRAYALIASNILDGVVEASKAKDATLGEKDKEIASLKLQLSRMSAASPSSQTTPETAAPAGPSFRDKVLGIK
jgi:hypothetical protein